MKLQKALLQKNFISAIISNFEEKFFMIVKLCESSGITATEDLEEKIQGILDEMQEKGFYLKHISYSSAYDYESDYSEKSAVLIFDNEK